MHHPLLALDTSTPTARVALLGPDGAPVAAAERSAARHSSNLLRLCDEVLTAAGVGVGALAAIACGGGPGSFTGLRVGVAVAKGLALPSDTPFVLVSSLEALAHDLAARTEAAVVVPCIDAGKEQVYAQTFRRAGAALVAAGDEGALAPSELCERLSAAGPVLVGGNGVDRYAELFLARLGVAAAVGVPGPSAVSVGRLAAARLARGERDDLERAVPSYGRPPDITKPRRP